MRYLEKIDESRVALSYHMYRMAFNLTSCFCNPLAFCRNTGLKDSVIMRISPSKENVFPTEMMSFLSARSHYSQESGILAGVLGE